MWRSSLVRGAILTAAASTVFVVLFNALLALAEPWNHSLHLWPTLTGSWYGELAIPGGGAHVIRLELSGDSENPPIQGRATTCNARGELRTFPITGGPRNWRGSRFWIRAEPAAGDATEPILLSGILGEWSGDRMEADATLEPLKVTGPPESAPAPVVRFTLERGGRPAFVAACQRLRVRP